MNKNKGFSLVELIVVVAIMAVLVGILAPAYLSYVEKTRRGADEDMAEEVRHSIEVATAEICVYDEVKGGATFKFANGQGIAGQITAGLASATNLADSMTDVYSNKTFDLKSRKYGGSTYTVTITAQAGGTGAALTVAGTW
ncbi:MAG: prepilin-type N-terminal cleavage/methylation domain-containing protein [Lachnospiraceae bacterium]|nr:prepilin-type N-terminal cleavage/methylation domain-containing protein [Lachnospiraceae bacterium]